MIESKYLAIEIEIGFKFFLKKILRIPNIKPIKK